MCERGCKGSMRDIEDLMIFGIAITHASSHDSATQGKRAAGPVHRARAGIGRGRGWVPSMAVLGFSIGMQRP